MPGPEYNIPGFFYFTFSTSYLKSIKTMRYN